MMECYFKDYVTNIQWAQFCISLLIFVAFREARAKYYAYTPPMEKFTEAKVPPKRYPVNRLSNQFPPLPQLKFTQDSGHIQLLG